MTHSVLSVAHRGYSSCWPENTVAACNAAIAADVDLVEADVRLSADGVLFCFHDADLVRLDGDAVRIDACSSARLRMVRIDGEPAASFAEILAAIDGRVGLLVDVKATTPDVLEALYDDLAMAGWPSGVWLGLRSAELMSLVRKRFANRVRILGFIPSLEDADRFLMAGADALRLWERHLDDDTAHALAGRTAIWVTAGGVRGRAVGDVDAEGLKTILSNAPQAVLLNDPTILISEKT